MRRTVSAARVGVVCLTLVSSGLLTGCVSPKYNYHPQITRISEPPLNTTVTAYIGDNMVRQGRYREHDGICVQQNVKVGVLGGYTVTAGIYLKAGEDATSEFYLPGGGEDSGHVITEALADPFQVIRVDKRTGRLCCVSTFNMEESTSNARYQKKKYPVTSEDSFQQTLIYSGKVGNKINVGYREFSGNLARPAFNNEVEYDLSESKTIGYKGARIEVIEATNQYIKYRVIQNFNLAER
ncbi:MAG: hypothetical protein A2Y76_14935 [Planctomycetes bacterium RBG_13_60_9]|nr:MAG: hypothetical protein A2Y76_14935 [Planctomycetes bacterium RBG_13_60_9]